MHDILTILKENKHQLLNKYPIKSLALFGSYSRGDFRKDSDIDIMVELEEPLGLKFIELAHHLEDLLKCRVDLVSKKGIKPAYMTLIENDLKYV
jgi:predicted nucleotidyltransferase